MPDTLPYHPYTGLQAVGIVGGRPVWPILGGSSPQPAPVTGTSAPPVPAPPAHPAPVIEPAPLPPDNVQPLGAGGMAALEAERTARKAAEKAKADVEAKLAAIEAKDMTELQQAQARLAVLEQENATEKAQRLRFEVATKHHIPEADLIFLTGTTEADLIAQATAVAAKNAGQAAATAPPTFAPLPGQVAGTGNPPAPTATVETGRALYRSTKQPTA